MAAKYVHRDQLAVLVVGNTKEFDKPLSALGPVKDIDITIPPPPGVKEEKAAKPQSRMKKARLWPRRLWLRWVARTNWQLSEH